MFGRHDSTTTAETGRYAARGGVSAGPIITGVLVALGGMFLLSGIVGGILSAIGYLDGNVGDSQAMQMGIGAGIALVIAQFLAYAWGGYTAGRMSRGAGAANGLLVPLTAILLALLVGGIVAALGANANLNLPFQENRLPLEGNYVVEWGIGIGIASLVAMFLGGALGGIAGARWHTKLERNVIEEERQHRTTTPHEERDDAPTVTRSGSGERERQVDLRGEGEKQPVGRSGDGNGSRTFRS